MLAFKRKLGLLAIDLIIINLAVYLALVIRFDANIPAQYINVFIQSFIISTILKITVYYVFGLYKSLWRYASIDELVQIFFATLTGAILDMIYGFTFGVAMPRSVYLIAWLLSLLVLGLIRLSYRLARRVKNIGPRVLGKNINVMIIGAGDAASMVITEMKTSDQLDYIPVVAIDDDPRKHRANIHGVPVFGGRDRIQDAAQKYDINEIIVAMPSASKSDIADILNICKDTKCKLKKLPGVYELINEKVSIKQIRDVSIEDILGREEIKLNTEEISSYLKDEVILVTGGGGSIGSELCRQVAKYSPQKLLILDNYENNAYDLQQELLRTYDCNLDLEVIIASVRDKERLREIFRKYKPGIVFHAAAHKHVPLMEHNPAEAIKNNVFGTLNTAQCADEFGVKRFVMISTDKAVNPVNIMGASKRVAEMIVQSLNNYSKTEFVAVRFGNVLGSNGSVIPLFKKQIAQGGPVTITHPDIIRYFMTIPEAVQLVIQAGAMAQGGEIFILDMGEPVKILDLARDLIRLSGFEPDEDIEIKFTGLRPGEKLYEELLLDEEGIKTTACKQIYVGQSLDLSYQEVLLCIKALENGMNDVNALRKCLESIVTTYHCVGDEIAATGVK